MQALADFCFAPHELFLELQEALWGDVPIGARCVVALPWRGRWLQHIVRKVFRPKRASEHIESVAQRGQLLELGVIYLKIADG